MVVQVWLSKENTTLGLTKKPQEASAVVKRVFTEDGEPALLYSGMDSRKKGCPYRDFTFCSTAGHRYLAVLNLTGSEQKLWNYLASKIDWNNAANVKHAEIGRGLKWDLPYVGRMVRCLINLGLIWRIKEPGERFDQLRLHPLILWKGSTDAFQTVLSQAPELHEDGGFWNKHFRKQCGYADRPDGWLLNE